jgi:2',3'-cyclic-nucleotide 2'-phosphodiesterase (5'-nucleotidase family)
MRYIHKQIILIVMLLSAMVLVGCCKDDSIESNGVIGSTNVELDARSEIVRTKENLIGNLIADAIAADVRDKGHTIDFAAINGGSIRFSRETRPQGIYPKGDLSSEMVDEMLPFGNSSVIIVVTGAELKTIFERSISEVERAKGQFLNVSSEVKVVYQLSNPPQVVNTTVTPETISDAGSRVLSIKINGSEISETSSYKIVIPDFIAEGNDGYVTFRNIPNERKTSVEELQVNELRDYVILNSPVNPQIEGRITIQ